jgi:hypothetical protein
MDFQYLITILLILILILQIYMSYTMYKISSRVLLEKFNNGCKPGQLKNFGICINPQN